MPCDAMPCRRYSSEPRRVLRQALLLLAHVLARKEWRARADEPRPLHRHRAALSCSPRLPSRGTEGNEIFVFWSGKEDGAVLGVRLRSIDLPGLLVLGGASTLPADIESEAIQQTALGAKRLQALEVMVTWAP